MKEGIAAVSNAEAALSTARTNLGYCYVRAPFDGTISKATVDIGSYVGGSLQPVTLATIYKDNQMYAYFNVADNQWLAMTMDTQQYRLIFLKNNGSTGEEGTKLSGYARLSVTKCRCEYRNTDGSCQF